MCCGWGVVGEGEEGRAEAEKSFWWVVSGGGVSLMGGDYGRWGEGRWGWEGGY